MNGRINKTQPVARELFVGQSTTPGSVHEETSGTVNQSHTSIIGWLLELTSQYNLAHHNLFSPPSVSVFV